jgi:hypothetical protein
MATTEEWLIGTQFTPITGTNLNALAATGLFLSAAAYNNTIGGTGNGSTMLAVVISYQYAVAPAVGPGISIWLLKNTDISFGSGGSTYEDGSASLTPSRAADISISVFADTAVHTVRIDIPAPAGYFKTLIKNNDPTQTFAANNTGSFVTITPYTPQGN